MNAEKQHKEANFRVIQPSKGGGGCIIDNRPSFMAINETKGLMRNNPVIQRMVIVGSEPEKVDSVIAADISFQHEKAGGELLLLSDLLSAEQDKFAIKDDGSEGIILTTHGEPGKVGDFEPSQIIEGLKKIKNISKAKYIYIASCDAATSLSGGGLSVIAAIGGAFPSINVCGAPGIAITDYQGISGDHQTTYKKNEPGGDAPFQDIACVIENAVTLSLYPEVKLSLGSLNLAKVKEEGMRLRSKDADHNRFNEFYDTLIHALLGELDIKELIFYVEKYGQVCREVVKVTSDPYYNEQLELIPITLDFVKKQIPVITDARTGARKREAPLMDKAGNPIFYDSLVL